MTDSKNSSPTVKISSQALPQHGKIGFKQISELSENLANLVERIKSQAFLPNGEKVAPTFSLPQLTSLCKITRNAMVWKMDKADELGLSTGTPANLMNIKTPENSNDNTESTDEIELEDSISSNITTSTSKRKLWTLKETREWVQACGVPYKRPEGVPGAVITVANFKGGVGKTMTTMTLAQGLSLMGYKVLAIDLDPQGSLTSLFGILPTDVSSEMTVLPIMYPQDFENARTTIKESIRPTYWDGLDLVAAARVLFNGEFMLPTRQINNEESDFLFSNVLNKALDDGTRMEYDYIIIDTMPALSYLTINTLFAADAVIMPLPPEGLDIASSAQFWSMFTELAESIPNDKTFHYIGVLPSKVEHSKGHTKSLLRWIHAGYGNFVLPVEIPETQVVNIGTTDLRTVYDITKYVGATKTYARARDAYDKLVAEIDHLTRQTCWSGEAN